jgi:hypothetical protein
MAFGDQLKIVGKSYRLAAGPAPAFVVPVFDDLLTFSDIGQRLRQVIPEDSPRLEVSQVSVTIYIDRKGLPLA